MKKPFGSKREHSFYIETAKQKVLEVFLKYPDKEFSLSDLAKEANVAKANLGLILEEFQKSELIEITKLSKIWRIKANQQNWFFIRNKIVYNLNLVYQSGLVEFLNEYFNHPKAIILFGSFRKGEDLTGSDIDLALEMEDTSEHKILGIRELGEFEKEIGRRIQVHLFNHKNIDLNLFNNIANGVVLSGFLEVKP